VEAKFVKVRPPAVKGAWAKDDGGWQTALVEFPPGMRGTGGNDREKFSSIDELDSFETYEEESDDAEANGAGARNKQKLGPALLLKALKRSRDSETNAYAYLVAAAKGFEEYGEMTIHALGVVTGSNPGGGCRGLQVGSRSYFRATRPGVSDVRARATEQVQTVEVESVSVTAQARVG
tara:strand:- start:3633 stop:4166 length:534 start_codon:yes stop_codon:yes gene_type:complete